jgi:uncharacterized membrane protein
MRTPASVASHPIHPMLVVFPIGLWIFSFISDVIFLFAGNPLWNDIAFYTMIGGLSGALLAAVPGLIDMFSIADPKAGKIAWNHMVLNLITIAFYSLNVYLRSTLPAGAFFPIVLSALGVVLLAIAGWLGGELAYVHGVGVEPRRKTSAAGKSEPAPNKLRRMG